MAANSAINTEVDTSSETELEEAYNNAFMTMKSNRKLSRKPPSKRPREDSHSIESLKAHSESDSSTFEEALSHPQQHNQKELKVLLVPIEPTKNLGNVNPMKIAKTIELNAGPTKVEFVKKTRNGLLIKCQNLKQYKSISNITEIGGIPVKVKERLNTIRGVITGVHPEITEEEIVQSLKPHNVVKAQRITRKTKKSRENAANTEDRTLNQPNIPTKAVILSFEKKMLPKQIVLFYQEFKVKEYIPPVPRCFNCQRMGHVASNCNSVQRCVRCGENHAYEQCPRKDNPFCINCKGNHSAAFKGCIEAKNAKSIQQIKVEQKISYADALKHFKAKKTEKEESSQENENSDPEHKASQSTTGTMRKEPRSKLDKHKTDETRMETEDTQHDVNPPPTNPASKVEQNTSRHFNGIEKPNVLMTATSEDLLMFLFHTLEIMHQKTTLEQKMEKFLKEARVCLKLSQEELEAMRHHGVHH